MEDGAAGEEEQEDETVAQSEAEDLCKIDEEFVEQKTEDKVNYVDHCQLYSYTNYNNTYKIRKQNITKHNFILITCMSYIQS